ncbi:insulinase family protein [Candidatus Woesearchaeota archaeon]|nr:insulinase family protein [Candidatus Woesearchaeota archaeon]
MRQFILDNGMKVCLEKMPTKSVAVELCVKTGSVNEKKGLSGISHFIEHMLFNGTKKRPDAKLISNEIEKLGGDFNAATSHERTVYYVKVPGKYLHVALDVLSDMLINPLFDEAALEKEKKIIIDEIKMINDQPRFFQWVLFQQSLFKKHPARNPIYGSVEDVKKTTRDDMMGYYRRFYSAPNISLFVVGDINSKTPGMVRSYFGQMKNAHIVSKRRFSEPKQTKKLTRRLVRNPLQSYMVLGYKTPPRGHIDSYALDIARAVLGKGQSGRIFDSIRTEMGLAYDLGVVHNPSVDFGFFAVYVSTAKENQKKVKAEILRQLRQLEDISEKELSEAKQYIEGEFILMSEDTQKRAELMSYWDSNADADDIKTYIKKIRSVTKRQLISTAKRWLDENYTLTVIE